METLLSNCGNSISTSNNVLWSSYLSNDQLDLTESFFDKDFGISDLFPIELPGSIHYDIKKIESSESSNISPSDISVTSDLEYDFPKVEIKNSDCMWSGLGNINNNIICNSNLYIHNNRNNNNNNSYQQQQQNNINNNEYQNYINTTTKLSMQNIPPGQSLLINSRLNLQNKKLQQQQNTTSSACNNYYNKLSIPVLMASDFLKDREQQLITNIRPDTPISLDDDAPEFKHSVDLAACIMGSNNISLDNSNNCSISTTTINTDQMIINKLKEQLEDTTTQNIDLRQIIPFVGQNTKERSLTEVLNVIGSDDNDEFNDDSCDDGNISDSDSDDDVNGVLINNCNNSTSSSNSSNSSDNISSNCSIFSSSSPSRQNNNYPMMHSDHSYTRSKDGVEDCAVDVYGSILETPSDSDEEIDVVSVGDKKLPTNPSDKDRRALQTKVAHKISARIVKTANGIRTIPPRRRDSYESFNNNNNTQIGTITPNKIKSLGNSRYPTPAPTPYPISIYNVANNNVTSALSVISAIKNTTNNSLGSSSRKRNSAAVAAAAASDEYLPSNKRHRGKKYQQSKSSSNNHHTKKNNNNNNNSSNNNNNNNINNNNNNSGSVGVGCDVEEADTIEKRNLHNDMERQRRIGLKNLFEALKKQIPSIKDKERAPKVNILREAAKLCDQLNRDDKLISNQKQQLLNQLQRREALLVSLKAAQCKKEI